jgi:hypothetical protein
MTRTARVVLWATVSCLLVAGAVLADDARSVRTTRDGDDLLVSFSVTDLFDASAEAELESGLPTRVAVRMALRREGRSDAVRASIRLCQITYDLWDEVFHIQIRNESRTRWVDTTSRRDAIRSCTVIRDLRFAVGSLPAGSYRLEVVAELNPVSTQMLEGLREWLRVPSTTGGWGSGGNNFFGSFVAMFISRSFGEADRTLRFGSGAIEL